MASTKIPKKRGSITYTGDKNHQLPAGKAQTSNSIKNAAQVNVLPLATAGNYSRILSTMDTRMNRAKLSSLHTSPKKFPTSENGQKHASGGDTTKSGHQSGSRPSTRGSGKVILPHLPKRTDTEGQGHQVAMATTNSTTAGVSATNTQPVDTTVPGATDNKSTLPPNGQQTTQGGQDTVQKDAESKTENGSVGQAEDEEDGETEEQLAKLTEKDWKERAEKKLSVLSELFKKTVTIQRFSEDGSYTQEFIKHVESVRLSYFRFKKFPLKILRESRIEAAKMLTTHGSLAIFVDVVVSGLESSNYISSEGKVVANMSRPLRGALQVLMNYADASDDLTYTLRDHEKLLPVMMRKIQDWCPGHMDKSLKKTEELLLRTVMSVVHNVAMRDDNIERLRQLGASEILLPYLQTTDESYKIVAVAILADVVTEEEADKLATSPETAHFLLDRLQRALKDKSHRFKGWSVVELVRAVRQLARNDANKRLLADEGAIQLLGQGIQSVLDNEKSECMECLWMLSFDRQNAVDILQNEVVMDSVVSFFIDHSQPKICRRSAQGILWQLRDDLGKSERYCNVGRTLQTHSEKPQTDTAASEKPSTTTATTSEMPAGHVMLSYQWANQETVKVIRDALRAQGYKVWMDIDDMGGSTLEAMAQAIEHAYLVLICMSQKYKDSPNCRAEAEYAFQKRKSIIPLLMQSGYRPDGWLGMILGAKLYYDFGGKYKFEDKLNELLKAVSEAVGRRRHGSDHVDAKVVEAPRPVASLPAPVMTYAPQQVSPVKLEPTVAEKIKTWQRNNVHDWLKKHGLDGTELERLSGREIIFLYNLRNEAPEYFYKTLEKKLQIITLTGLISFTDALSDLPQT